VTGGYRATEAVSNRVCTCPFCRNSDFRSHRDSGGRVGARVVRHFVHEKKSAKAKILVAEGSCTERSLYTGRARLKRDGTRAETRFGL